MTVCTSHAVLTHTMCVIPSGKCKGDGLFAGCIKGLREKGMPKFRQNELKHWVSECKRGRHPTNFTPPDFYGNLYFKFNVVFPDNEFISDDDDIKASL